MAVVRAHVYISGEVQGVLFRAHTQRVALQLNVSGWVRNLADGRVEAVFEGDEEGVQRAVEWCRRGPPLARVSKVEVELEPPRNEKGFRITY